ncbi:MAG: Methionyl-tRNA formyltransferase [Syntrophorhabdus sp. PtaB.Bin047]|nr:MAG: Methionyl-tRNA formyltransferase [Syntrophorhabdus sp. PtaB.Bin047]
MRIVFFGSSAFSVPSLLQIKDSTVAVVTKRARPRGRGYHIDDNEVKSAALRLGLPLIEIDSFRDDEARSIAGYHPDLYVVVSFGLIVPKWALDIPTIAPINIHPSLLPLYRGPSPMQWALLNGDAVTGITFIRMNEKMDEGDIIGQEEVAIERDDDYTTLSKRLSEKAAQMLQKILDDIGGHGMMEGRAQDHSAATYAPIITKEMGRIDWTLSAARVDCQVKAFVTWPTAFTYLDGKLLKIYSSSVDESVEARAPVGTITGVTKAGLEVATGKGLLIVGELQLENKKRMKAYDFSRGYRDLQDKLLK